VLTIGSAVLAQRIRVTDKQTAVQTEHGSFHSWINVWVAGNNICPDEQTGQPENIMHSQTVSSGESIKTLNPREHAAVIIKI